MKLLISTLLLMLSFQTAKAQISEKAYRLMLNSMLSRSVPEMEVTTLKQAKKEMTLLDAREKNEFQVSHLKGAINVGYNNFHLDSIAGIAKDAPIVVYCSIGYRSEKVAEQLQAAGFENVFNLYGGIFSWVNDGNAIFRNGEQTEEIHGYNKTWGIWLRKGKKVYD